MKSYEYIVKLKDEASDSFKRLAAAAGFTNGKLSDTDTKMKAAASSATGLDNTFRSLGRTIATVFAIGTISGFVAEARDASIKIASYKSAFQVTTGNGDKAFEFVRKESDRLGLSVMASAEGFKTLSGATMGTKLAGAQTEKIFTSVAQAASKLKISADDQKGAYLALGQMLSKGKVSAEELRGQLGERLSGAFRLFSQAVGVSTSQLDKMLQKGEIIAVDTLPKFAKELDKSFGNGGARVESMAANMQRAADKGMFLKAAIGDGLQPIMNKFYLTLAKLYDWGERNIDTLKTLGITVAVGVGIWGAYTLGVWLATVGTAAWTFGVNVAKGATLLFSGQFAALNTIMALNPVGLIVVGIAALAAGFIYAYNKVDEFRGGLWGLWEASKQVFTNIGSFFSKIFEPIFTAWDALKQGKIWEAAKASGQLLFNITPVGLAKAGIETLGKDVGKKYNAGREEGIKAGGIKIPGMDMFSGLGGDNNNLDKNSIILPIPDPDKPNTDTGKSKSIQVNTTVGDFNIHIHSNNLDEGLGEMENKIKTVIARIINGGVFTATQ